MLQGVHDWFYAREVLVVTWNGLASLFRKCCFAGMPGRKMASSRLQAWGAALWNGCRRTDVLPLLHGALDIQSDQMTR